MLNNNPDLHSSAFVAAAFALIAKGYTVEIKRVARASYHAKIRDSLDGLVGDLEWRDPIDERNPRAQGLSSAGYSIGQDEIFRTVLHFIK